MSDKFHIDLIFSNFFVGKSSSHPRLGLCSFSTGEYLLIFYTLSRINNIIDVEKTSL